MTEAAKISWSHSALEQYRNCPFRYYRQRIVRDCKDTGDSPALKWGNDVHKAMEDNLNDLTPLPPNMASYEKWCDKTRALAVSQGMQLEVEIEMAFNNAWQTVGWWDGWFRCKADVLMHSEQTGMAINIDWKTNKRMKSVKGQDALNAAATFLKFPHVNTVATWFVFLTPGTTQIETFERSELGQLVTPALQTLESIATSRQTDTWVKRPSGLCKFCIVKDCEHHPG